MAWLHWNQNAPQSPVIERQRRVRFRRAQAETHQWGALNHAQFASDAQSINRENQPRPRLICAISNTKPPNGCMTSSTIAFTSSAQQRPQTSVSASSRRLILLRSRSCIIDGEAPLAMTTAWPRSISRGLGGQAPEGLESENAKLKKLLAD